MMNYLRGLPHFGMCNADHNIKIALSYHQNQTRKYEERAIGTHQTHYDGNDDDYQVASISSSNYPILSLIHH